MRRNVILGIYLMDPNAEESSPQGQPMDVDPEENFGDPPRYHSDPTSDLTAGHSPDPIQELDIHEHIHFEHVNEVEVVSNLETKNCDEDQDPFPTVTDLVEAHRRRSYEMMPKIQVRLNGKKRDCTYRMSMSHEVSIKQIQEKTPTFLDPNSNIGKLITGTYEFEDKTKMTTLLSGSWSVTLTSPSAQKSDCKFLPSLNVHLKSFMEIQEKMLRVNQLYW